MAKFQLKLPFINLLIFKLSWYLLVFFQESAVAWSLLLLLASMSLQFRTGTAWKRAVCIAVIGVATDQLLSVLGVFDFETSLLPLWLIVLWLHFGMVLPCGFGFLQAWPRWGQALAGIVAGPLSYGAGSLQGGVQFPFPLYQTLLILALVWGLLLPGLIWLAARKSPAQRGQTSVLVLVLAALTLGSNPSLAAPPELVVVGEAEYRYLWWPLYKAKLHGPRSDFQFPASVPFKLSLTYERAITKQQLIAHTVKQWKQQGITIDPHWQLHLQEVLVDVSKGDTLSLYIDDNQASLFSLNGQALGTITDKDFSTYFAGIWLASNTTEPKFRQQLMGL